MNLRLPLLPLGALGLMVIGGAHPREQAAMAAPGRLAWPLTGWVLTQGYGCTSFALEPVAPECPGGHFHAGLDLAAPAGTPVRAASPGTASVVDSPSGYGLHVVVDHGGGVATLYAHLQSTPLHGGQAVDGGELLGQVGSTGLSTGPHLHFEVRRSGRPVDPTPWLPAARNQEVVSMISTDTYAGTERDGTSPGGTAGVGPPASRPTVGSQPPLVRTSSRWGCSRLSPFTHLAEVVVILKERWTQANAILLLAAMPP